MFTSFLDLMKVKRTAVIKKMPTGGSKKASSDSGVKKADALISRYASCMCFDFHTIEGNMYVCLPAKIECTLSRFSTRRNIPCIAKRLMFKQ